MISDELRRLIKSAQSRDPRLRSERVAAINALSAYLLANAVAITDLMNCAEQAVIYRTDIGTRETAIDNMETALAKLKGVG